MGHDSLKSGGITEAAPGIATGRGTEKGPAPSPPAAPPGPWPVHGGPDAQGAALHDFSTNSNACGPCPLALTAVQQADATRYPDPAYTALRAQLAAFHGVAPGRIVLAASASECIHRLTALAVQQGAKTVALPAHSYGDYAQAALARGLRLLRPADAGWSTAGLQWACEPSSPLGGACPVLAAWQQGWAPSSPGHAGGAALPLFLGEGRGEGPLPWHSQRAGAVANRPPRPVQISGNLQHAVPEATLEEALGAAALRALDCAYAPLHLHPGAARPDGGRAFVLPVAGAAAWQLWTPNKALGLTGVRAAYAIAPAGAEASVAALTALAPSWPVGAHGVALLTAWVHADTQRWLAESLQTLQAWKALQLALCASMGWSVVPGSLANYFVAQVPVPDLPRALARLRCHGIKLRDGSSFGLPGHVRLGVLAPGAQQALHQAWTG